MSCHPLRLSLVAVGMAAALAGPAAAASTPIGLEQRPATVAGYEGVLAWSHYAAASNRYQLLVQRSGQPAVRAPVPDARRPFDVDLGGNRSDKPTAVYTRCAHPGSQPPSKDTNPRPGSGCDIYRYVLGASAEEHLTQLSSPDADERQPTISRGEIAFVRREHSGHGRVYDTIRIGNTTGAGTPTKVLVRVDIRSDTLSDPDLGFGPRLPAGSLAYVIHDPGHYGFSRERVRVLNLNAKHSRQAYTALSGGANAADVTRPSWDSVTGLLYFARTNQGSGQGTRFVRWSHATHRLSFALGDRAAVSTGWVSVAQGLFVADAYGATDCLGKLNDTPDKSECRLYTTGPLSFTAKP